MAGIIINNSNEYKPYYNGDIKEVWLNNEKIWGAKRKGFFLASGGMYLYKSSDGVNWESINAIITDNAPSFKSITKFKDKYILLNAYSGGTQYSYDLNTWYFSGGFYRGSSDCSCAHGALMRTFLVEYDGYLYTAAYNGGYHPYIFRTSDGISWQYMWHDIFPYNTQVVDMKVMEGELVILLSNPTNDTGYYDSYIYSYKTGGELTSRIKDEYGNNFYSSTSSATNLFTESFKNHKYSFMSGYSLLYSLRKSDYIYECLNNFSSYCRGKNIDFKGTKYIIGDNKITPFTMNDDSINIGTQITQDVGFNDVDCSDDILVSASGRRIISTTDMVNFTTKYIGDYNDFQYIKFIET